MIERTATSLESCQLQRVLRKPTRTAKRSQKLHTGFWQHGASAIELSSIWPATLSGRRDQAKSAGPLQTTLVASAFLLDFLYPNTKHSLLRRLYPGYPYARESPAPGKLPRRRHTTASDAFVLSRPYQLLTREDEAVDEYSKTIVSSQPRTQQLSSSSSLATDSTEKLTSAPLQSYETAAPSKSETLSQLLSKYNSQQYQTAWDLYCQLEGEDKSALCGKLLKYLSKSKSSADIGRAVSLFRQIPSEKWDDIILASGILVLLQSGEVDSAVENFRIGLRSDALTGGLEHIVLDAFTSQNWQTLLSIWFEYYHTQKQRNGVPPETSSLSALASEPRLTDLFFALDRYLTEQGIAALKLDNFKTFSKGALYSLRRGMAEIALSQPCDPAEATKILSLYGLPSLYKSYLETILAKVDQGVESRPRMAAILNLYQTYREMRDAEFSQSLLRSMFYVYHAVNRPGLEEVYRDWHRQTAGGLDQWGYEKFLAYYASAGDVTAVQDLWNRYVASFPSMLQKPRAFYTTLTAYAQAANTTGAEKELQTMEEHGITPDVRCLNILLSCYVRANADDKAEQCFQSICAAHKPTATTFGHAMAMSARRGDLEKTIALFNKARVARIKPSADMVLGLVSAYLRNDQTLEAEHICTELAERGATSTEVWNQLIHHNGLQGRLNKCYQLLQTMGQLEVEWNQETYEYLLYALVRVNQIQPAYKLLRSACKESMFPIAPEHFAIVMDGAVRAGQLELAEIIYTLLQDSGLPTTFNIQLALFEGAYKRSPTTRRTRSLGRGLADHLRSMVRDDADDAVSNSASLKPAVNGDVMSLNKQTRRVSHAIKLLIKLREYSTAEELVTLYTRAIPTVADSVPLPPNIIASLMEAYAEAGDYDRIMSLWKVTWKSMYKCSRRQDRRGIYAAFEYSLTQPIAQVAKAYKIREDGPGLLRTVNQARDAGFRFTRNTWNVIVRYLAALGQWEAAMQWCEIMLMPRWRGWTLGRGNLQERRELSNARVLQASKPTILSLQQEWLRLRKLAVWSAEVSGKLKRIEKQFPKLHFAFTTIDFDSLPEKWTQSTDSVGEAPTSLTKAVKHLLEPMNLDELRSMRNTLSKSLRGERRKVYQRKVAKKKLHVRVRSGM